VARSLFIGDGGLRRRGARCRRAGRHAEEEEGIGLPLTGGSHPSVCCQIGILCWGAGWASDWAVLVSCGPPAGISFFSVHILFSIFCFTDLDSNLNFQFVLQDLHSRILSKINLVFHIE
jgi:hypothetical protein